MDAIGEATSRRKNATRAWVKFEKRDIEDKKESASQGKYVGRDEDYAIITPAFGKDDVHKTVKRWKEDLDFQVRQGLLSHDDHRYYMASYEYWKKGEEAPVDGTPIKGWGVISLSQQKMLTSIGIRSVEELAAVNDEGIARIGMGGADLRRKAGVWLTDLNDRGPLTQKMAAVEKENDNLKIEMETLKSQVAQLTAMVPKSRRPASNDEPDK